MPQYRAKKKLWLSNECRHVEAGEVFSAEFPKGMKLEPNIEPVKPEQGEAKGGKGGDLAG